MLQVAIRAEYVTERNGTIILAIETQPISTADGETLARLFPHTSREIDAALEREAFLACIVPVPPAAKL